MFEKRFGLIYLNFSNHFGKELEKDVFFWYVKTGTIEDLFFKVDWENFSSLLCLVFFWGIYNLRLVSFNISGACWTQEYEIVIYSKLSESQKTQFILHYYLTKCSLSSNTSVSLLNPIFCLPSIKYFFLFPINCFHYQLSIPFFQSTVFLNQ